MIDKQKQGIAPQNGVTATTETCQLGQDIVPARIYTTEDVQIILGCGEKTLKSYRDEGYLSWCQREKKIWYFGSDLLDFLRRSHNKAWRDNLKPTIR